MIHFVGASSGTEDLICVQGKELIEKAAIIIYADSMVNPELLEYAKDDCEIYNSEKMTLDEVLDVIMPVGNEKEIVWLSMWEPGFYREIREQMDWLEDAGVAYDVCKA